MGKDYLLLTRVIPQRYDTCVEHLGQKRDRMGVWFLLPSEEPHGPVSLTTL